MSEQPALPWYARLNVKGVVDEEMLVEMRDYYGQLPDWIVPGMTALAFNLTHYEQSTTFASELHVARLNQKKAIVG